VSIPAVGLVLHRYIYGVSLVHIYFSPAKKIITMMQGKMSHFILKRIKFNPNRVKFFWAEFFKNSHLVLKSAQPVFPEHAEYGFWLNILHDAEQ
jgi:hypothetical protein